MGWASPHYSSYSSAICSQDDAASSGHKCVGGSTDLERLMLNKGVFSCKVE
jgi:hypothetical protein